MNVEQENHPRVFFSPTEAHGGAIRLRTVLRTACTRFPKERERGREREVGGREGQSKQGREGKKVGEVGEYLEEEEGLLLQGGTGCERGRVLRETQGGSSGEE